MSELEPKERNRTRDNELYTDKQVFWCNVLAIVIHTFYKLYNKNKNFDFLCDKQKWGYALVIFCCCAVSGQSYNFITGSPLIMEDLSFIMLTMQGQCILESYVVACLYMVICACVIILIEAGRGRFQSNGDYVALGGVTVMGFTISTLLMIFRMKCEGDGTTYPFG